MSRPKLLDFGPRVHLRRAEFSVDGVTNRSDHIIASCPVKRKCRPFQKSQSETFPPRNIHCEQTPIAFASFCSLTVLLLTDKIAFGGLELLAVLGRNSRQGHLSNRSSMDNG
ncbi:hypothetical protein H4Q26_002789 [Puccinia striiformis f. sp. tritici PST-130]|nr:hypothetical protein H4Q26_002789 [Puccinia striiformis f. sp. tritici PST-130]